MIDWLGTRVLLLAWFTGVATFAGGALGGLLSGSLCRAFTTSEDGGPPETADAICESFLGFGIVCLAAALAIGLLVATTAWRRSRSSAASSSETDAPPPAHAAWLLVPGFILIAASVITWVASTPLLAFLAQYLPDSQGLGGIVLLPPGFMLGAAATLLFAEAGLLLLLWARSPRFPHTYVLVASVHLGLIVCSWALLDAVRSISDPAGSELPVMRDAEAAIAVVSQSLTWSLTASAAGLPLLLLGQVRALFRPRPPAVRISPRPAPSPAPPVAPRPVATLPRESAPMRTATVASSMPGTKYYLRALFVAWPLAGRVRIDDLDEARTLTASLVPLSPWPTIHVWLETSREHVRLVTMESRQLFGLGNAFDILDGITREPLAIVKKPFAGEWLVYAPSGDLAAIVAVEHSGLGAAQFVVRAGEQSVAIFRWSNMMRPSLELDFSGDSGHQLDRRLGIALGVLLFFNMSFRA